MNTRYIDRLPDLIAFCERQRQAPWLALDTEFMREKTYRPIPCLIQIAAGDEIALIDPLRLHELAPLFELLLAPATLKILHAAGQDLEVLHHLHPAALPAPIFDTQLAAALLGYGAQVSYADLVHDVLGVRLDKVHTRSDWSRRPLPPEVLAYAADDVRYLGPLHEQLQARLQARGRLDWLREDFAALSNPARYHHAPEQAWRRLGRLQRLRPQSLLALQQLAAWRERLAQEKNLPRQWVLKDEVLYELANRLPTRLEALAEIHGLSQELVHRHGQALLSLLAQARDNPQPPQAPEEPQLAPEQEAITDLLMALVRSRAEELQISPALLATRRELERLTQGERELAVLQGWRLQAVGHELLALLQGTRGIKLEDGRMQLVSLTAASADPH